MNKTLSAVIIAIFLIMLSLPVKAADSTKITLAADKQSYQVNDTVNIAVKAENAKDIYGAQFKINYDKSFFQFKKDSLQSSVLVTVGTKTDQGVVSYVGSKIGDAPGENGNITIVSLQLTALKEGKATLLVSDIQVSDSKGNLISVNGSSSLETNITAPQPTKNTETTVPKEQNVKQTQTQVSTKPQSTENVQSANQKTEEVKKPENQEQAQVKGEVNTNDKAVKNIIAKEIEQPEKKLTTNTKIILVSIGIMLIFDMLLVTVVQKNKKRSQKV